MPYFNQTFPKIQALLALTRPCPCIQNFMNTYLLLLKLNQPEFIALEIASTRTLPYQGLFALRRWVKLYQKVTSCGQNYMLVSIFFPLVQASKYKIPCILPRVLGKIAKRVLVDLLHHPLALVNVY